MTQLMDFKLAIKRLFLEGYLYRASALAYTTLLSIVPLFTVALFIFSLFPIFISFINLARIYLLENFIPNASDVLENYLANFIMQASHLPPLGFLFLFVTIILLIMTIDAAFNDIWKTDKKIKKFGIFLLRWSILGVIPFIIGIGIFLSFYITSFSFFNKLLDSSGFFTALFTHFSILVNTLFFSFIYIIIPKHKIKWSHGFYGGFVAAILLELAKLGFKGFIQTFNNYTFIYGALSIIPIFLVWIYLCWVIILFGALLVHAKFQRYNSSSSAVMN